MTLWTRQFERYACMHTLTPIEKSVQKPLNLWTLTTLVKLYKIFFELFASALELLTFSVPPLFLIPVDLWHVFMLPFDNSCTWILKCSSSCTFSSHNTKLLTEEEHPPWLSNLSLWQNEPNFTYPHAPIIIIYSYFTLTILSTGWVLFIIFQVWITWNLWQVLQIGESG